MKKISLATLCTLLLSGSGFSRTWTNADGSKTFEGDFVSCTEKTVTVKRGRREMTFKMELLSAADQKGAKAESKRLAQEEANKEAAADFKESDFGKALANVKRLDGTSFVETDLDGAPKFIILYFSASW